MPTVARVGGLSGKTEYPLTPMPAVVRVMQPAPASAVPRAPSWMHEPKHDGWRIVARIADSAARVCARSGQDYTRTMAPIAKALTALPCREAIIDGEVAAPEANGVSRTLAVRRALQRPHMLTYYAFDLLWLDGEDTRELPLIERKRRLEALVRGRAGRLIYVEHLAAGHGQRLYDAAIAAGCDSIMSRRGDSRYCGGRTRDWLTVKLAQVRAPAPRHAQDGHHLR